MSRPTDEQIMAELSSTGAPWEGDTFTLTDEYLAGRLVPRYVAAERMTVCHGCDAFNKTLGKCSVNNWVVAEAAGSNKTACPKGKW